MFFSPPFIYSFQLGTYMLTSPFYLSISFPSAKPLPAILHQFCSIPPPLGFVQSLIKLLLEAICLNCIIQKLIWLIKHFTYKQAYMHTGNTDIHKHILTYTRIYWYTQTYTSIHEHIQMNRQKKLKNGSTQ